MRTIFLTILSALFSLMSLAQQTQVVRGVVIDDASNAPVPFVNIVIPNTTPTLGAATDSAGRFRIVNVPTGSYTIRASAVGYKLEQVDQVEVTASKEVVLTFSMKYVGNSLAEIVVKYQPQKNKPLNNMAMVSARMLSVEEAKRYAGAFDDPSRLVTSFAGVAGNIGSNGIVVRGNAPQYLQWKMEGVEIPNPNHFADLTTFGGGGLTALSNNLLANCDFFTGAFPAEYSNALSGVFDIFMRNGNNQKREHTFQLGLIGIDASSEGPLGKPGGASYLFNYRYSTLTLMKPFLPENAAGVKYQDLSFKLNFPIKKAGTFTLWGIGLIDGSGGKHEDDSTKWYYRGDKEDADIRQYMATTGLTHKYFFNNNTYLKTILVASVSGIDLKIDELDNSRKMVPENRIKNNNTDITLTTFINKKISNTHTNRTGLSARAMAYSLNLSNAPLTGLPLVNVVNATGYTTLLTAYTNSSKQLSPKVLATAGINGQLFTLNNHYTIEPRAGLKWLCLQNHALALGYGLHSRLERLYFYFNRSQTTGEANVNKNLDFSKAHHLVASWDWNITDILHLKAETYYQSLFNIPVIADSSFSFVNMENDWFFAEKLQNTGKGRNYGLDLTFERYMNHGYYYMLTASLFNSQYQAGDKQWRSTRYNRNYLFNGLAGKEWRTGPKKQNALGLNIRFSYQGGDRYSPVNTPLSIQQQNAVYDERNAFSMQLSPTFTAHFTASYKLNRKNTTHEVAFKMLNITGQKEYAGYSYNLITQTINKRESLIFIPNLSYRIEF